MQEQDKRRLSAITDDSRVGLSWGGGVGGRGNGEWEWELEKAMDWRDGGLVPKG